MVSSLRKMQLAKLFLESILADVPSVDRIRDLPFLSGVLVEEESVPPLPTSR